MAIKGRKRKILLVCGIVFASMLLILLAVPTWFPWLLKPIAHRFGVSYERYERAGYGRFVLRQVKLTNAACRFQAGRVQGFVPTAWLWHHWLGPKEAATNAMSYLRAENWKLEVLPQVHVKEGSPISVYTKAQQLAGVFSRFAEWVPKPSLTNGVVL